MAHTTIIMINENSIDPRPINNPGIKLTIKVIKNKNATKTITVVTPKPIFSKKSEMSIIHLT